MPLAMPYTTFATLVPPPSVRHHFAHFYPRRGFVRAGSLPMIGLVRAAALCATLALGLNSALAADKAFRRDDLADAAIKLEAQIKSEAGAVASRRRACAHDADAAFRRNDFRGGLQILGQIAATRPRTAPTGCGSPAPSSRSGSADVERTDLLHGTGFDRRLYCLPARRQRQEEADALAVLGEAFRDRQIWRPALDTLRMSLDLREVADVRGAIREAARRSRLPPGRLQRRFDFGFAAGLLPVLRRIWPSAPTSPRSSLWPAPTGPR